MAARRASSRIVLVSFHYPPVCRAGAIRTGALTARLLERGFEVTVLCPPVSVAVDADRDLESLTDGAHRVRVYCPPLRRRPLKSEVPAALPPKRRWRVGAVVDRLTIPDRMVLWSPFLIAALRRLVARERPDAVICSAPPFSSLLAVAIGLLGTGVPFIADYRDPWALCPEWAYDEDFKLRRDVWTRARWALERRLERFALRRARAVSAVTPGLADALRDAYSDAFGDAAGASGDWLVVSRNGVVPQLLRRALQVRTHAPAEGPFVLTHVGNFYDLHGSHYFLAGLRQLLASEPEFGERLELRFYGCLRDRDREELQGLERSLAVRCFGVVGYVESLQAMAEADALLICLPPWVNTACWLPMKSFAYLSLRKPVLAVIPPGELDDLLRGSPWVERCHPENPREVVDALRRLLVKGRPAADPSPCEILDFDFAPLETLLTSSTQEAEPDHG